MPATATYLREQAHRCVRLARECPHLPTSHELEALGIEFMERAAELDKRESWTASQPVADDDNA
jgi:hypothetical protein